MKMSFENLYMSHSMHDLFNQASAVSPADSAAIELMSRGAAESTFTLEAMMAAPGHFVSERDFGQYAMRQAA